MDECKTCLRYWTNDLYPKIRRRWCKKCLMHKASCINCRVVEHGYSTYVKNVRITNVGETCIFCSKITLGARNYDAYVARNHWSKCTRFLCGLCANNSIWTTGQSYYKLTKLTHPEICSICSEYIQPHPPPSLQQIAIEACGELDNITTLPKYLQTKIEYYKKFYYRME